MSVRSSMDVYELVPALYRLRDVEQGYPLRALLQIIGEQADIVKRDIDALWDDYFIETCADWVIPYIGDLVANNPLYEVTGRRADVAKTIYYRRRKGTLPMLEELARDVTGWRAHAVAFFESLGWRRTSIDLRYQMAPNPRRPRSQRRGPRGHGQPAQRGRSRPPGRSFRRHRPHCGRAAYRPYGRVVQHSQDRLFPLAAPPLSSGRDLLPSGRSTPRLRLPLQLPGQPGPSLHRPGERDGRGGSCPRGSCARTHPSCGFLLRPQRLLRPRSQRPHRQRRQPRPGDGCTVQGSARLGSASRGQSGGGRSLGPPGLQRR